MDIAIIRRVGTEMRSHLRNGLHGISENNDRLWVLHTPDGDFAITEYNDELTGYDPRLAEIDPKIFHYGGNAYYIIGTYCDNMGWSAEHVEDRR